MTIGLPPRVVGDEEPCLVVDARHAEKSDHGYLRIALTDEDLAWLAASVGAVVGKRLRRAHDVTVILGDTLADIAPG